MTDVRALGEDDVDALQRLLEACTEYAEQVTGYPTGPSDALSTLLQLPEGLPEDRKQVLGLRQGPELLGVADVLFGYPDHRTTTLGLLLVHPEHRRLGLGRRLHDHVARNAGRIRVGVVDTNAADSVPFLTAVGYRPEGDAVPYRYDQLDSTLRHWVRG